MGIFSYTPAALPTVFFCLVSSSLLHSQSPLRIGYSSPIHDSLFQLKALRPPKSFGRSSWQLGLVEITPWLVDNYVRNEDYTHISLQTISYNIRPGNWAFDNDPFVTNQFGHPYHGSMFYSAFRANGYDFWQSVPAAFVGSYLWETFSENQAPSTNDFINTGFGGVILGEMTFRLSNRIINERSRGLKRQVSEVLGLLVNPLNGLNRIMDGRWGKVSGQWVEKDSSKIFMEFDAGARRFKVNSGDGNLGFYGHIKFLYGTPFDNYKKPFSHLMINTEFGKDDSSLVNILTVYGSVAGWQLQDRGKVRHLALVTLNYDFIRNKAFFYSSQNIKINLFSEFRVTGKISINTTLGTGVVILAAVPDIYITPDGRNYDYASGAAFNGGGMISFSDRIFYSLDYKGAWLKTLNGSESQYYLHIVTSEFRYRLNPGFSVCVAPGYYFLKGRYKYYQQVNTSYPYLRISIRFGLNL